MPYLMIRPLISIVLLLIFHGVAAREIIPHKPREGDFPQKGGKATEESMVLNNRVEGKPSIPKGGIESSMVNVHQGKDVPKGGFQDVKYPFGGYPRYGYGGYPQRGGYYRHDYPRPGGYYGGYPRRGGGGYYRVGYPRRGGGGYYRVGYPRRGGGGYYRDGYPVYGRRHCRFGRC